MISLHLDALANAAAEKLRRRGTGGWEDLLEVPADQRGGPPTAEQLALLQEQVRARIALGTYKSD